MGQAVAIMKVQKHTGRIARKGKRNKRSTLTPADNSVFKAVSLSHSESQVSVNALMVAVVLGLYSWLIYLTSSGEIWWWADVINNVRIFALDDAYRFFIIKGAWTSPDLYNWSYVLPVPLVMDGLFASLSRGSLVFVRLCHAMVMIAGFILLYKTSIAVGVNRIGALLGIAVLAFMPLFVFVSISMYGESWLAIAVSLMLYGLATGRRWVFIVATAITPLIRPEGIYFVAPAAVWLLLRRDFKGFFVLILPGLVYAAWLLLSLDRIEDYVVWRREMRYLLSVMMDFELSTMREPLGFFKTYSLLWLLPAGAAFVIENRLRALWPVWVGGLLWVLFLSVSTWLKVAEYEERYLVSVLPIVTVAWSVFICWAYYRMRDYLNRRNARLVVMAGFALIIGEHLLQMMPLKEYVKEVFREGGPSYAFADGFLRSKEGHASNRNATADLVHFLCNETVRSSIDTVLVSSKGAEVFYVLDPKKLSRHITTAYMPSGRIADELMGEGQSIFAMHPGGRQYAHYQLGQPDLSAEHLALYIGTLPSRFKPGWVFGQFRVYLVTYKANATMNAGATDPVTAQ